MKKVFTVVLTSVFSLVIFSIGAISQQDKGMTDILRKSIAEVKMIEDYTATVYQIQRVGGRLLPEEVLSYKFRRPNSIYIRWIGDVKNGREIIYSEGWNNNKFLVHEGGIIGLISFSLYPNSKEAMRETRHPVNESSIVFMMDSLEGSLDHALLHPEDDIVIEDMGEGEVFERRVKWIRLKFPFGEKYPYYAPLSIFGIDAERFLPLYYKAIGSDGVMWEEYRFKDIKTNVGISDSDFDPKNPEYGF